MNYGTRLLLFLVLVLCSLFTYLYNYTPEITQVKLTKEEIKLLSELNKQLDEHMLNAEKIKKEQEEMDKTRKQRENEL